MSDRHIDINNLRVASPCQMSWAGMTGGDRSRVCTLCELNVYNVAGMTTAEVERLVFESDGRLCMRLYRRSDGTVITKDCPVGARSVRKRLVSFAGAAFAAMLGLFSVSYGQKDNDTRIDASKAKIVRSVDPVSESILKGKVVDVMGASIPGVTVRLYREQKKVLADAVSDEEGDFRFASVPAGVYEVRLTGVSGFRGLVVKDVEIRPHEMQEITFELEIDGEGLMGVIVTASPEIDLTSNERKTVITREMLDRMPGGRPF